MSVTDDQIRDFAGNKPQCMVVVYAKWCGHCLRMMRYLANSSGVSMTDDQMWNEMPSLLAGPELLLIDDKQLAPEALKNVRGVPDVRLFSNGQQTSGSVQNLYNMLGVPPPTN
jgi:hypothetical protein